MTSKREEENLKSMEIRKKKFKTSLTASYASFKKSIVKLEELGYLDVHELEKLKDIKKSIIGKYVEREM